LLGSTENVAGVYAKEQGEEQDDQSGAPTDRDLPTASSATTAHLRRVKLGSLVVFHISPTASNRDAAMLGSIAVGGESRRGPHRVWHS
jgi:hypothetical protein